MSVGLYKIEISYGDGYKTDERSGYYFGELKEILPRISDGMSSTAYIVVSKIYCKTIDNKIPKKSVCFYCYDKNLKKELEFCGQGTDEDYFVYTPKDLIEEKIKCFQFDEKDLEIEEEIIFSYEGKKKVGKIAWFDYDKGMIKVIENSFMYTITSDKIIGRL